MVDHWQVKSEILVPVKPPKAPEARVLFNWCSHHNRQKSTQSVQSANCLAIQRTSAESMDVAAELQPWNRGSAVRTLSHLTGCAILGSNPRGCSVKETTKPGQCNVGDRTGNVRNVNPLALVASFPTSSEAKESWFQRESNRALLLEVGCQLMRDRSLCDAAVSHFRLTVEVARECNDLNLEACAWNCLAMIYRRVGDDQIAANCQQKSFAIEVDSLTERAGNQSLACDLGNLANDAMLRDDLSTALRLAMLSLRLDIEGQADPADLAADWGTLGVVQLMTGRCQAALRSLANSLRIHRALGDVRGISCNMLHLGQTYAGIGDWRRAERWIGWAVRFLRRLPQCELHDEADCLWRTARSFRRILDSDPNCN